MAQSTWRSNAILAGNRRASRVISLWRRPFAGDTAFFGKTTADGATGVVLTEVETIIPVLVDNIKTLSI